jgi:GAF domain
VSILEQLLDAVGDERGAGAADRLCEACVGLFEVDGAAISLVFDGTNTGTLGASGPAARVMDELQFTLGEGPCLDSVAERTPVLIVDLAAPGHRRWPAYSPAMLDQDVRGVFAMPVVVAGQYLGALDLFRSDPGQLGGAHLAGALVAAELAEMSFLDLLGADLHAAVNNPDSTSWSELNTLSRAEVSQATGVLVAQLDVEPAVALVRLRAHAYATGATATAVARDILDHRLFLEAN